MLIASAFVEFTLASGDKIWLNREQITIVGKANPHSPTVGSAPPGCDRCTIIKLGQQRMVVRESIEQVTRILRGQ